MQARVERRIELPVRAGQKGDPVRALISLVIGALVVAAPAALSGAGGGGAADHRLRPRFERRDAARRRSDGHADRHRQRAHRLHRRDGGFVIPNLPVGPYQLKANAAGIQRLRAGRHRAAGELESGQINITMQIGAVSEQLTVTANATMVETRSTGIGQVIDNQRVVELPLNGRQATELIFLVGPGHLRPGRRPQHQQELPDGDDLGGRRPGQRHDLHHGRRHAQRPVQQPQPADAVPRRPAGVQGRDQRSAGPLRPPRLIGRQLGDQVGHQRPARHGVHVRAQLPLQRPQRPGHYHRQPRAQPVRWRHRRPARSATRRSSSGPTRAGSRTRHRPPPSAGCRRRRCWPATSRRWRLRPATVAGRSTSGRRSSTTASRRRS